MSGAMSSGFGNEAGSSPGMALALMAVRVAPGFNKFTRNDELSASLA